MELYVKQSSNCPAGLPLIDVTRLSPTWEGAISRCLTNAHLCVEMLS